MIYVQRIIFYIGMIIRNIVITGLSRYNLGINLRWSSPISSYKMYRIINRSIHEIICLILDNLFDNLNHQKIFLSFLRRKTKKKNPDLGLRHEFDITMTSAYLGYKLKCWAPNSYIFVYRPGTSIGILYSGNIPSSQSGICIYIYWIKN